MAIANVLTNCSNPKISAMLMLPNTFVYMKSWA